MKTINNLRIASLCAKILNQDFLHIKQEYYPLDHVILHFDDVFAKH
jgi:hypothetical protein